MSEIRHYTPQAYPKFNRLKKKLPKLLRMEIDQKVDSICQNPCLGELKTGNLAGVRVYKFYVMKEEYLLAYTVDPEAEIVLFLAIGGHENFYRDLKKYVK